MKNQSRRQFFANTLGLAVLAATSSGLLSLFTKLGSTANAAPKSGGKTKEVPLPAGANEVPANDPVATAIGYVSDASKVDAKANPTFKKGQDCASCALYTKTNEGWGRCQMIQTGLVRANGWCRSYSKKA